MIATPRIKLRQPVDAPDALPADLHPVIRRILLARGVTTAESLQLGLGSLQPPGTLSGLDEAAGLLADAVTGDQDILVVGDFDADGATGTALAIRALQAMGATRTRFRVPNRFEFGYGLTPALVETIQSEPPDVLVTVDSGICCNAGVASASGNTSPGR